MKDDKTVYVKRKGAKWEAWGFVLILASVVIGIVSMNAAQDRAFGIFEVAASVGITGVVVFLIGRFK